MKRVASSLPATDDVRGRIVLRDGSVAVVRRATGADRDVVRVFFHELSPEAHYQRFFSPCDPPDKLINRLCDSTDPARGVSLLAWRQIDGAMRLLAIGSYIETTPKVAEVAFAVDDRFHGKGLATALLERLAIIAVDAGFERFFATTLHNNAPMIDVFRDCGFQLRSKSAAGCMEVQLSLTVSPDGVRSSEERDRLATAASISPLLEPAAVAVVGVSRTESSLGRRVCRALVAGGFKGAVVPVNPNVDDIDGLRCYRTLREAPHVDLAVIAVPREAVLGVVDDCAAAGVRALVVISAGFAESGEDGRALQRQLLERVRGHGMRMVGPNCMGLLNATDAVRMNASFSPVFPSSGTIALSSQSGALGLAILALAGERGLGFSTFVSVGNKADVSSNDLLQYWEQDAHTRVILLYLESFGNPRRFARLARRIGQTKPIVAVKSGRTKSGGRAAGSHTAALAASDAVVAALFRQTGVIRADTIDEMFDIAACLDTQPLPRGRRVAIVTNAGGPGILAVDACEAAGLTVPEFEAGTRDQLAAFLPSAASSGNPVDMVASAGPAEFRKAVEVALTAREADALIVIYTPVDVTQSAETLEAIRDGIAAGRQAGATEKPVVACLMAETGRPVPLDLSSERVPTYRFPENAARALAKAAAYADWRRQPAGLVWGFDDIHTDEARAICRQVIDARGTDWLTPEETWRVLCAYGLQLAAGTTARTADDAAAIARLLGFPVVAKLLARGVVHKTEVGGVRVNLNDETAVRKAFTELLAGARTRGISAQVDGVLVQATASGIETMVGVVHDPVFGPLVGFGLGGVHVELLGDVQFRIAPLTDRDVDELMHEARGYALLEGYRGQPRADIEALREILLRVSRLADDVPEILELDLNPVIVPPEGHGCRLVDARIKVGT